LQHFAIDIEPRFYETDALGHINNASIAAWLEIVRMKFIDSLVGAESMLAQQWILASLQIDFAAETFFGDMVSARVTRAEPGNTSLTVHCELWQGETLTVRGRAVMVFMDAQTRKPAPLPQTLRRGLADLRG
jgi:acyl-CoA thioester hydrolase